MRVSSSPLVFPSCVLSSPLTGERLEEARREQTQKSEVWFDSEDTPDSDTLIFYREKGFCSESGCSGRVGFLTVHIWNPALLRNSDPTLNGDDALFFSLPLLLIVLPQSLPHCHLITQKQNPNRKNIFITWNNKKQFACGCQLCWMKVF